MDRAEVLTLAEKIVCKDRNEQYGSPEYSFAAIANLWSDYLRATGVIRKEVPTDEWGGISPKDVAAMMVLLKIARVATGHGKADNWIDAAGYAACGGEIEYPGGTDAEKT